MFCQHFPFRCRTIAIAKRNWHQLLHDSHFLQSRNGYSFMRSGFILDYVIRNSPTIKLSCSSRFVGYPNNSGILSDIGCWLLVSLHRIKQDEYFTRRRHPGSLQATCMRMQVLLEEKNYMHKDPFWWTNMSFCVPRLHACFLDLPNAFPPTVLLCKLSTLFPYDATKC